MLILSLLYRLFLTATVATAHAATTPSLGGAIQSVGSGLLTSFGGAGYAGGIDGIAGKVVAVIWIILLPVGIFLVVRAGFSLIISQDEGKLSTAKRTIAGTLIGIVLVYISQELVKAFFTEGIGSAGTAASTLQGTVYGLVNWSLVMMAALGVLMIVVSVLRAIANFGKEEGVTNIRQTILGTATGILMISLAPAVKFALGIVDLQPLGESSTPSDAQSIIIAITGIVAKFLVYLTLIAVIIVIYAGIRMIVNLGNDDEYTKAKTLIGRALIGLTVILISYIAVIFLLHLA